jgi:hypothetical protein
MIACIRVDRQARAKSAIRGTFVGFFMFDIYLPVDLLRLAGDLALMLDA